MTLCARFTHKNESPRAATLGDSSLGYLSDFMCLPNHLLTQSPTKRAMTATTNDIMYCTNYTSFLTEEADKLYYIIIRRYKQALSLEHLAAYWISRKILDFCFLCGII